MRTEYSQVNATFSLVELVEWGARRIAEADRIKASFIVIQQIYRGSARISSRIEQHACVVGVFRNMVIGEGSAFAVLERVAQGWIVSDFLNCSGDRIDVNARLAEICRGAAA